jgi:polar amino acid transport system permease protein
MNTVETIYSQNFLNIPLLLVASFWYLVLTTAMSIGQHFVERHFGKGVSVA